MKKVFGLIFLMIIFSCGVFNTECIDIHNSTYNFVLYYNLIKKHEQKYHGDDNFRIKPIDTTNKYIFYDFIPLFTKFKATYKDTIGVYSNNLPYSYVETSRALYLYRDTTSVLTTSFIRKLNDYKLIDSTLYAYNPNSKNTDSLPKLHKNGKITFRGKELKKDSYYIDAEYSYIYKILKSDLTRVYFVRKLK